MKGILAPAWLVLVLACVFGAALAGMQALVADQIAENKLRETLDQIPALVPGADAGQREMIEGRIVYRALSDGETIGWVIPADGQGFADVIEVLIGVTAEVDRLTGMYVLEQKETPGLGNKITEGPWLVQFAGKALDQALKVVKYEPKQEYEIETVTGATISSEAVCDIVNDEVDADLRSTLQAALNDPQGE
jgi:electron transport complex protein RnfG